MSQWLCQARPIDAEDELEARFVTFAAAKSKEGAEAAIVRAKKRFENADAYHWRWVEMEEGEVVATSS